MKKPGYLVKTKNGKIGRTFNSKGLVNGKVPVYLATQFKEYPNRDGSKLKVASEFSDNAILCDKDSLKVVGIID